MGITERIDAITALPVDRAVVAPSCPRSVKIELTARCDFKCWFCATSRNLRKRADMDFNLFKRIAREMRDAGVEELGVFYLGESFLYPDLVRAIHFAKHECGYPYVFLTTNGRLAIKERVRRVIEAGLDSLKFSFNWADAQQCADVTKVDAFLTVINNIRDARTVRDEVEAATGHRCGIYASSIRYDGEQQKRMEEAIKLIAPFVDEHYWLPLYNQAALIEGIKVTGGNQGRIGALRHPIPCWAAFTEGHVTFDGKLSACCFDHTGQFTMGDLTSQGFMEAWNSPAFQQLRAQHLAKDLSQSPCANCVQFDEIEKEASA